MNFLRYLKFNNKFAKTILSIIAVFAVFSGTLYFSTGAVFAQQSCAPGYHLDITGTTCVPDNPVPGLDPLITQSYFQPQDNGKETAITDKGTPQVKTNEQSARETAANVSFLATAASKILTVVIVAVDFLINFGKNILDVNGVKTAWSIVLSIANLGFIIGLVVIAFATILHIQSYAIKKILWKLIVAALLVNFSFFIVGAVVETSNVVSDVFLSKIGDGKFLGDSLGNLIRPQDMSPGNIKGADSSFWDLITGGLKDIVEWIASFIFIIVFMILMILVLLALSIMLLVRIVAIMILAIVSPFAFICWIFPGLNKHWKKWWSELIRWNLFVPIILFFLYVTVLIANGINQSTVLTDIQQNQAYQAFDKNSPLNSDILAHAMRLLIVLGFMVGGLLVANSYSITGSSFALNSANKLKGWAGGKIRDTARRRGLQAGTAIQRTKPVQNLAEGLQKVASRSRLARWAGFGAAGRGISKVGVKQGEQLVKDASKLNKGLTNKEAALAFASMSPDRQFDILNRKDFDLKDIPEGVLEEYVRNGKLDKMATRYGQGKAAGKVKKSLHMDKEFLEAADEFGRVVQAGPEEIKNAEFNRDKAMLALIEAKKKGDPKEIQKAKLEFIEALGNFEEKSVTVSKDVADAKDKLNKERKRLDATYSPEDFSKISAKAILHDRYGSEAAKSVLENSPAALNKMMPKVSGKDLPKFTANLESAKTELMFETEKRLLERLNLTITSLPRRIDEAREKGQTKLVEQLKKIQSKYTTDGQSTVNVTKINALNISDKADLLEDMEDEEFENLKKNTDIGRHIAIEKTMNKTFSKRLTGEFDIKEEKEEKEEKKEEKKEGDKK